MKETLVSNCEKSFVLKAISEGRRLDGRLLTEYRPLEIQFGADYGCCQVSLGETRVLAQVSCEIQQPKATRPNEGILHINIGLSPMGAPHFEVGRQSDTSIQLNRLLEKCIKDSKCVDLESLCIVAEEKVWVVRLDLNILNHEGDLIDCSSIAALAALSHFKRPDVELDGDELTILDAFVRDPVPLSIRHYPVCVSFAIFNEGTHIAADPSQLEERVAEAQLTLGVNGYRELCGVYLVGSTPSGPQVVKQCSNRAANRATEVVKMIKEAVAEDSQRRLKNECVGFVESVKQGRIMSLGLPQIRLPKRAVPCAPEEEDEMEVDEPSAETVMVVESSGSAQLGDPVTFIVDSSSDESSDVETIQQVTAAAPKTKQDIVLSGDSEEEDTVTILSEHQPKQQSNTPAKSKRKSKKRR